MTTLRRQARSYALQLLYRYEVEPKDSGEQNPAHEGLARERFWAEIRPSRKARTFATELVEGVVEHQKKIHDDLHAVLEQWKLSRLPVMVRVILKLAAYELIVRSTEPPAAIINEAMELTRTYMDEESVKFVNSVLDRLRRQRDGQAPRLEEDSLPPPPPESEAS